MPSIPPDDVYLNRLRDYYARYHGLPSYSRLAGILGIVSRSAVGKVLGRLRDTGYLARTPDDVWVPTPRFFERQLADGHVPAGRRTSSGGSCARFPSARPSTFFDAAV